MSGREKLSHPSWYGGMAAGKLLPVIFSEDSAIDALVEKHVMSAMAADREKVARFMLQRGFATGHGDSIDDLLRELGRALDPKPFKR